MPINVRGAKRSPYCEQCPCARDGKPMQPVPAFGGTGGFCIVGEAPGRQEVRQGVPFIGPSGQIVRKAVRRAGGDWALIWVTNALLCQRPSSDADFDFAVECCRERLRDDLEQGQPTAICALGGTAMKALQLPVRFVSQARGTVQETPLLPGVPVIGALHPAALLHGGAGEMTSGGKQKMNVDAQAQFLFSDIAKTMRIASGEVPPIWSDDIQVVHEAAEVAPAMRAILEDAAEEGLLGLDLEWTCDGSKNALDALGAEAHRARITWVGIGCRKRSVSFAWSALVADYEAHGPDAPGEDPCPGLVLLQAVMEDESISKLAHNKQADKAVWEAQIEPFVSPFGLSGLILSQFWDSMLMHHGAFPGIDHDLQQVASQFLCVPPWKVDHAKRAAEWEAKLKAEAKAVKAEEKERKKLEKKAAHDAANAQKAAEAEVKKALRQAEHQRKNAAAAAEKAARKAQRQAEHEARNAASAAEKQARKAKKKSEPVPHPRQMALPLTERGP